MKLCICTKFHEYILNSFRNVKKIYIFDGLKNDTVDNIFKLKTPKGIILLQFRCSYDSCSLVSDHTLNLYQVS